MNHNKFFLFISCFFQVFCYRNEKLTWIFISEVINFKNPHTQNTIGYELKNTYREVFLSEVFQYMILRLGPLKYIFFSCTGVQTMGLLHVSSLALSYNFSLFYFITFWFFDFLFFLLNNIEIEWSYIPSL